MQTATEAVVGAFAVSERIYELDGLVEDFVEISWVLGCDDGVDRVGLLHRTQVLEYREWRWT